MPSTQDVTSVAGLTTTANLLTGNDFERAPRRAKVNVVASDVDGAAGDITVRLTLGGRTAIPTSGLQLNAAGPSNDSDAIGGGVVLPGELIRLEAVNTNAAARIIGWRVILTYF